MRGDAGQFPFNGSHYHQIAPPTTFSQQSPPPPINLNQDRFREHNEKIPNTADVKSSLEKLYQYVSVASGYSEEWSVKIDLIQSVDFLCCKILGMVDDVNVNAMTEAGYKSGALHVDLDTDSNVWSYYYRSLDTSFILERTPLEDERLLKEYFRLATKKKINHQYPKDKLNLTQKRFVQHIIFLLLGQLNMNLDNSEIVVRDMDHGPPYEFGSQDCVRFHLNIQSCTGKIQMMDFCNIFIQVKKKEYAIQRICYNHTNTRGLVFSIITNPKWTPPLKKRKSVPRSDGNNTEEEGEGEGEGNEKIIEEAEDGEGDNDSNSQKEDPHNSKNNDTNDVSPNNVKKKKKKNKPEENE